MFHGSYRADDVQMLLTPLKAISTVDIEEKERLIQSGRRHYSEMISPERLPSDQYLALFQAALRRNGTRMARDCLQLAEHIAAEADGEVAVVSLARAGIPVGVIVHHLLPHVFARPSCHYSISIIRDRGVDGVALDYIRDRHPDRAIVFVDGWTGKGVIARELESGIAEYNQTRNAAVSPRLFVLSDLCGAAYRAPSWEDYLIPSSILNSTVSGLVSRSILNEQIEPGQFHGCVYYSEFAEHDLSRQFVDEILHSANGFAQVPSASRQGAVDPERRARLRHVSGVYLDEACKRYGIRDINLIKPGIGEATRVLLRRVPERLILRDKGLEEVAHLRRLAEEKGVQVVTDARLPYKAVSIIRSQQDG